MKVSVVGPRYKKLDPTDYQAMADSMGVGDCVSVRDEFVEPKDFPALFSGVDIALVPYRELQGSGTLILAYCYLKPAIVSDLPLLMEETLDGATGLAFKNEDPADLARAMRRVLAFSEADMDERRKKIRDLVENKYNWVHSARLLHESYGLCLERKRKKGL